MEITNRSNIRYILGIVHDSIFTEKNVIYNMSTKTFSLKLWQVEICSEEHRKYWRAYHFVFRNVIHMTINKQENHKYYELSTVKFDETTYRLDLMAHYGIDIVLQLLSLDGELQKTEESILIPKRKGLWGNRYDYNWDCLD